MASTSDVSSTNIVSKIKLLYISIAMFLGGALVFDTQLKNAIQSRSFEHIILALKVFKIEIFIVLILLIFWQLIVSILRKGSTSLFSLLMKGKPELKSTSSVLDRPIGILLTFICLLTITTTGYHFWYLMKGRNIYFKNYDRILILNAEESLRNGELLEAKDHFEICVNILASHRCETLLNHIDMRIVEAKAMQKLQDELISHNYAGRIKLAQDIKYLIKDQSFYNSFLVNIKRDLTLLNEKYSDALNKFLSGDNAKATSLLTEINKKYPGFGDAHIILAELKNLDRNRKLNEPYLSALRDIGVYKFINLVVGESYEILMKDVEESYDEFY